MTREDIIRMARQAGWEMDDSLVLEPEVIWYISQEALERLAALVAVAAKAEEREKLTDAAMKAAKKAVDVAIALEREACAKVCEEQMNKWPFGVREQVCAAAIRARKETK